MRRFRLALLIFMLVASAHGAIAEVVYVESNSPDRGPGQGWLFKHGTECLLATANHVLPLDHGTIVTTRREFGDISRVIRHPDPDMDLLVATVEGRAKTNCPSESLGYPDSRPALSDADLKGQLLKLEFTLGCDAGSESCYVTSADVKIDSLSPLATDFFFIPQGNVAGIVGGDSGSIVRQKQSDGISAGQPLGLVISAQQGAPSRAIVFSEVRKFVESLSAGRNDTVGRTRAAMASARASAGQAFELVDFRGTLTDPSCGPLNALIVGQCLFRAAAAPGASVFEILVKPTTNDPVSKITFEFAADAPLPNGVEIAAVTETSENLSIGAARWSSLRYCRPSGPSLSCSFVPLKIAAFLIRVPGAAAIERITYK